MSNIDSNSSKKTLYLDIGNSSIKGAFRNGVNWETIHPQKSFNASDLIHWIGEHPEKFKQIVVASVRRDVFEAISQKLEDVHLKEITIQDIPRDLLDYESIDTLGIDRFLGCFGATKQTSNSVVVIDAGTAITVDFMDQDDVFHGGIIAPGLAHFLNILPQQAPALPKVISGVPDQWPGKNTHDSLRWGQEGFYKMALENILKKYEQEFGEFDLFITGGNGQDVKQLVDSESKYRPFLVFEGMERVIKLRT